MALSDHDYPMKRISSAAMANAPDRSPEPHAEKKHTQDEADLARFGKKQQLKVGSSLSWRSSSTNSFAYRFTRKRCFGLVSIVGLTCTLMVTWEGSLIVFQSGLTNGGPAGLIYGFLFTWIGTGLQTLVMAEMASMVLLAGGQYNWVSILSPKWCSKFLSYLAGWMTVISWQAALASTAFLGGTIVQGLLVLNYPGYVFERWHGTLLFYAIIGLSLFINTYLVRLLPKIEAIILIIHIIGFTCILIPLIYLAPHSSAKEVFATFNNGGAWATDDLSFFVGLTTSMFAFIGADAATHMAEEIEKASVVIPRSMLTSVALNGALGFAMVTATLFCLGNEQDALNSPTGFPFIEVFASATGSNAGANAMTSVIIAAVVFGAVGCLATASRMAWAFARERGLPASSVLAKVEPHTSLPLYCIGLSTVISLLLALINIGSSKAFNALTSLVVASFYTSFALSAAVFLHKKLTTPAANMIYGPFRLGGASIPIIISFIIFSVVGIFFSFWPPTSEVTAVTMNWSVLVFSGVLIFSLIFWAAHGRKVYTGPILETGPS